MSLAHRTLTLLATLPLVVSLGGGVQGAGDAAAPQVEIVLDVYEKTFEILGTPYQAWTFDGTIPAPIIRIQAGTELTIRLRNGHTEAHSIHTHIQHYDIGSDGTSHTAPLAITPHQRDDPVCLVGATCNLEDHPTIGMNPIGPYLPRDDSDIAAPGQSYTYHFKANEVGTFLYHCHVFSAVEHIERGMYGLIIVYPRGWSWEELPRDPDFGNTDAWVTDANGKRWFEDVVMLSELDPTGLLAKAAIPTTGGTGKVFVANMHTWNDPYYIGPVREGTPMRLVVANIGHELRSWHVHAHNFDVLEKFDPQKKTWYRTDTLLVGPGESYETTLEARGVGFWLGHDHIVPNAYMGSIPWLQVTE